MLNSLVCLASQFAKELANVDGFLPLGEQLTPLLIKEAVSKQTLMLTSVEDLSIQKLVK